MNDLRNLLGEPTDLTDQSLSILASFKKPVTPGTFMAMVSTISLEYLLEPRIPIDPVKPDSEEVERVFLEIISLILSRYGKTLIDIPLDSPFLKGYRFNRDVNDLLLSALVMEAIYRSGITDSDASTAVAQFIKNKFPIIYSYHWTLA